MKVKSKIKKVSHGKDKRVYCEEGDILDVIKDYGNILIVRKKERFAIKREEIHEIDQ